MGHFFITVFERLWLERNNIWKNNVKINWEDVSKSINRLYWKYWKASVNRKRKPSVGGLENQITCWQPPLDGYLKIN